MTEVDDAGRLSSDKPSTDPATDRLGYAPFARTLANAIVGMAPSDGLVIAVYGAWGLGKSTLLNYICHYLCEQPEDIRPIVVTFNPWWFSGAEDLTRRFFDQLRAEMGSNPLVSDDLRRKLADFASIVSKVPIPYADTLEKAGELIRPKEVDIVRAKAELSELLAKQRKRFLIILDDIDRLTADETREIFRLVKSLADFPNTIYLLAFDRNVVSTFLEKTHRSMSTSYLDKIVQVSFELPLPPKNTIRTMFTQNLDKLIASTPDDLFEEERWLDVYFSGLKYLLNTPRDVVRLMNTLSVTYPAVDGEVNIVDFVALESIRIFLPELYDRIRSNQELFIGQSEAGDWVWPVLEREEAKVFDESWLGKLSLERQRAAKSLVQALFPGVGSERASGRFGRSLQAEWRNRLRICSPDVFPTYFRFALNSEAVSMAEVRSMLALADDPQALADGLVAFVRRKANGGSTGALAMLERLEDQLVDGLPANATQSLLVALLNVGDMLATETTPPGNRFEVNGYLVVRRLVREVAARVGQLERFATLSTAMENGKAVSTIADTVGWLGGQHGKYQSSYEVSKTSRLLSLDEVATLEGVALEAIRQAARGGSLLGVPGLGITLYLWAAWVGPEEPSRWVADVSQTDQGLVQLLDAFVSQVSGSSGVRLYIDSTRLEPFIELKQIYERVRRLLEGDEMSQEQAVTLRAFADGYRRQQEGKDASGIWD